MKRKSNKKLILAIVLLAWCLECIAQIEYAVLTEQNLHFPSSASDEYAIWAGGDSDTYKTETTNYNFSFFPYCWKKIEKGYGVISGYGADSRIFRYKFNIYPQNTLDSIRQKERYQFLIDSIAPIVGGQEKANLWYILQEDIKVRTEKLLPLYRWISQALLIERKQFIEDILAYASFDFIEVAPHHFWVYLRNKHELTVWAFDFPFGEEDTASDWTELVTYSNIEEPFQPFRIDSSSILPKGDKHIFQSIADSLFFKGHYKVIRQDSSDFLVNTYHGAIYYRAPNQIVKVGQIQNIENYPAGWFIKTDYPLFIEDQDRGELVFFTEVERITDAYPFPKVVIIPDKATARSRFGNLIRP